MAMPFLLSLVASFALFGCTSDPGNATRVYATSSATMFEAAKQRWLVSDKPEKTTLVLQLDSFGAGTAADVPRQAFEQAAAEFLEKSGRKCRILSGSEVMARTYEFAYRCDGRG